MASAPWRPRACADATPRVALRGSLRLFLSTQFRSQTTEQHGFLLYIFHCLQRDVQRRLRDGVKFSLAQSNDRSATVARVSYCV
jgi:hypothetical protein